MRRFIAHRHDLVAPRKGAIGLPLGVVVPGVFFLGVYLLDLAMLALAVAGVLYLTRRADEA